MSSLCRDAGRVVALMRGLTVVHRVPPDYEWLTKSVNVSATFRCEWCGADVEMREMRSHGGTSVWAERKETVSTNVEVGCWELKRLVSP